MIRTIATVTAMATTMATMAIATPDIPNEDKWEQYLSNLEAKVSQHKALTNWRAVAASNPFHKWVGVTNGVCYYYVTPGNTKRKQPSKSVCYNHAAEDRFCNVTAEIPSKTWKDEAMEVNRKCRETMYTDYLDDPTAKHTVTVNTFERNNGLQIRFYEDQIYVIKYAINMANVNKWKQRLSNLEAKVSQYQAGIGWYQVAASDPFHKWNGVNHGVCYYYTNPDNIKIKKKTQNMRECYNHAAEDIFCNVTAEIPSRTWQDGAMELNQACRETMYADYLDDPTEIYSVPADTFEQNSELQIKFYEDQIREIKNVHLINAQLNPIEDPLGATEAPY